MTIRLLLAEDHNIVRQGLRALVEKDKCCEVVAEAADGREAVEQARLCEPDVVLLDVVMPGLNGIDAARRIQAERPGIGIVMLSMYRDPQYVQASMESGASAYVLKDCVSNQLLETIKAVARGERGLVVGVESDLAPDEQRPQAVGRARLTIREREVWQLLAEGNTTKEAAFKLQVSPKTIESHRARLFEKLGCRNVVELTHLAVREGLIRPGD